MGVSSAEDLRTKLKEHLSSAIQTGEVTLASGRTTDFYFDGRLVTLDPEGLAIVSELCVERLRGLCEAVGGPSAGADPMVAGIGLAARGHDWPLRLFFTRKEAKAYGMQRRWEGPPLQEGDRAVIVDDVATSGGSLIRSAEVIRTETPATVTQALVIVDREEGATEALKEAGIELLSLFRKSDFM